MGVLCQVLVFGYFLEFLLKTTFSVQAAFVLNLLHQVMVVL
ncbi:Hypothetical protein I595_1838 [Croceitalea dokdonensis DOKDO 023]|uniref:Uncharacterized protein n=1 Tax=Croceitalea dokdonensis DOKDO 023 TaxID=1300341 RepID=A0A0P7AK11_9FLAO|nr:Hypothetical protein I595_1838 [Croceitalea dokdonensis DOKDO 023]